MEKKETKRILKTIEYYYSDGKEHKRCPVCGIDPVKLEQELDRAREEVITEIYNFVEGESGRSGRKEILEFIFKLTTK